MKLKTKNSQKQKYLQTTFYEILILNNEGTRFVVIQN